MSTNKRVKRSVPETSKDSTVLYSYWRSSCSWRVRIALNLKGIDYTYVPVHLVKNEQMEKEYVSNVNPSHEVPALKIDGHTLCQSLAIIEYLDETRPEQSPLLPRSAADRAAVRQLCDMIAQDIQPVQNLRCLRKLMSWYADDAEEKGKKKMEWGKWVIEFGFTALEAQLKKTSGKYCFGDSVTMADLCLVPQVYNANRFKCDMSKFPTINKVHENLVVLKEFKEAVPEKMPDAQ
eukprot:g5465.t1